ncbi:PAS domain S-box protein [Pontibacter silvestris]|uniref:histidine kinase n=1 Tax=Pontibacter silvestris TaxID=2305183 RepID=A0ABW4X288_9BACT|nr:PAS domain S-box protein [Pontibacter silvestris]MCC9134914.1 PAS domain S-box protein [Pontibacter silvestris]
MPNTTNWQPTEQLKLQAELLLNLLAQLAQPTQGLLIALPDGRVLAADAQTLNIEPSGINFTSINHLQELLNVSKETFEQQMADLQAQKKISGYLKTDKNSSFNYLQYIFKLVQYQNETFICVEVSEAGQASTFSPLDSENYYSVFENNSEPLFILNSNGNFIDANHAALSLVNKEKDQLMGQSIFQGFNLNLFERVALKGQLQQVLAGEPRKFEWWLQEKNQELLPIEVALQKGNFKGQEVILGAVKNLLKVAGTEQEIRFRNHQLEFVNQLITKLSSYDSQENVLKYTLEQLLEKSNMTDGCVYTYQSSESKASLLCTVVSTNNSALPAEISIDSELVATLLAPDKRKSLNKLRLALQEQIQEKIIVVPVATDQELLALILFWPGDETSATKSFLSLLAFVGSTIGNYIVRHQLQQQLTLTENRYKFLFEASYDAILLFYNGVVVECNSKATNFFGCTREELIGHSPTQFSPEFQPDGMKSSEKTALIMEEVLATGKPALFEWLNVRKDGSTFFSEINANRLIIDGKYYIQVFKRDITQQKLAEAAKKRDEISRESMAQFRSFLEKVNLIYYSLDTKGNLAFANDYFLKYIEYSREEVIGKSFYDVLVSDTDREQRRKDFFNILETKHLSNYYERDILTKSGKLKTIRWNSMLEFGPDGEVRGLTVVGKDMTDKRIAMEALKDNKIRLQDLFDNAHDLIQNISADNKFIFVNKAWKDRLGYSDHDIESLTLNEIVHPYYKAKLIYQLRNLYKGENVNKIETVFLTKAGKPVHLIGSITCSWQDGRPVATRAILHDITDRIKAERLQKVYYSIANLAISSKDLNSLYSAIHRELSKIIETRNIYIALCDQEHKFLNFVYLVDQFVDKADKVQKRRPFSSGLSEYIIETGKPLYIQKQELLELAEQENLNLFGTIPEVLLCSPLAIGDRIIGVIALQDYQNPEAYVNTDIEILHFISNQVALAIERKRNEEQINNQNARLKAIFESGTHHMWSLNRNFELTSFNRNFANDFEARTGEELELYTPLNHKDIIPLHENSYEFWKGYYEKAFEGVPQHFEVSLQYQKGWREVYLNPIFLEDGSFDEISGIALDITDKKESQLALVHSEEKFRHIFESFQDVYYRISIDGTLELVSPSVHHLLGYREEEVIGKPTANLYVNPKDLEGIKESVLTKKIMRDVEVEVLCKDQTPKTVILDSRLITDENGTPTGMEGVIRDVSELKRTQVALLKAKEEAENLLKVKTQFLANMSHELRTPMNGIIGMIDLLNQVNTDPEQSEYIETLRKSSDALLAILNDILDLSKIQAGKLVLHENSVDVHETLEKIHSLFINRAQQKDLQFTYQISPDTPQYIYTDETRLLQILSNLTSNAIKFTNSGAVGISVSSVKIDNDYYQLHIRVNDSGIGISPEDQELLFTDFTQLDNSSTKTFGGTGLGLAISKQLSNLLGGDIGVESAPETGSTFWFDIVARKATPDEIESQIQHQQQSREEVEALESHPTILLVDDNQINQKVAQKLLERLGCITDVASNGYEAIEKACTKDYNIIFMDIQMPEMDGVTATGHIKERLGTNCPPIIAMTAYSMKDDASKFMNQGMDDYVSKPVRSTDLHSMISKWENKSWSKQSTEEVVAEETQPKDNLQPIIDENVLEQLKMIGGEEFTKQLYMEFEEEAAGLLQEAKKDLEAQHYKSILSTLHQLKGTGFTLGINQLAELAKQLEHDIKQDQLENVKEKFSLLLEQYENYRNSYKDIITS